MIDDCKDVDYSIVDNNPSESFDKFSYNVVDETIDDLKKDIITLDDSVNQGLSVKFGKPNTSELAIRDIYKEYGDKLGIKIGYTDFKEYISNISENNKIQRDIIEAINAKIAVDITQRAIAKLILTFSTLIDRSCTMILKMSEGENAELTPELIGMADKCMQWINQMNDIKNESAGKYSDPDKTILRITEKVRSQYDAKKSEDNSSNDQELINSLIESLRS